MLDLVYIILSLAFLTVCAWCSYNLPILAAGVRHLWRSGKKLVKRLPSKGKLPTFSIVIPVKNEEKVIGRLLEALTGLNYPADKKEIIVVEDGSTDRTLDICMKHAEEDSANLKVLSKPFSKGKPSALNLGVKHARGEIIGVFDADSIPAQDSLMNACKYFEDPNVAAVQGRTLSINSEENMLTRFLSCEEAAHSEAYLRGKDALGLFVYLRGSCQFIRLDVLEELKGFDENALSEDLEISVRLAERGYKIRYASDVRSWQESPADLRQLFRQRTRWFRGTMEVAFRYGKLVAKPSKKNVDAEATLLGPFILIISLMAYFTAFYSFFVPLPTNLLFQFLMQSTTLTATIAMFLCGLALIFSSKPRKATSILWVPFIYFYWSLQVFIALYSALLILLHRPPRWSKTEKSGVVTSSMFP